MPGEASERLVDLADVERSHAHGFWPGELAVDAAELGHGISVIGVSRVAGRANQFVSVDAAAVLGRAVTAARQTDRLRVGGTPRQHRLKLDGVLLVVTVVVEQLVADIGQHLV